ncbi:sulfotransferase [Maridesulfovibrio zosterae]|uniref:sulfotransferase n=1 Tax=Maridesulfovibrio zosterae TaxID=82171 RepID=UPI0003FA16DC|nr:sulfotransferase [Maridesulfovibrio zosterae]
MKYAFLLYDSRSGSTLLSSLLNLFSGIIVTQESAFIPLILENFCDEGQLNTDHIIDLIYSEPQFCDWNINKEMLREKLSSLPRLSYKSTFDVIIDEYLKVRGEEYPELIIVKGPRYEFHLNTFKSLYDDPLFINLIRDGRAVYNSKLNMVSVSGLKMSNNVFQSAFEWRKKLKGVADQPVINLRFEDLVADNQSVVSCLLDKLAISASGREISSTQEEFHKLIGNSQKHLHTNVNKAPDKSIAVKWRKNLSDAEVWIYEKMCGKLLVENGYDLYADSDTSAKEILSVAVRHAIHWCWLKVRNLFYYTFIDGSIIQKLKGKRFE